MPKVKIYNHFSPPSLKDLEKPFAGLGVAWFTALMLGIFIVILLVILVTILKKRMSNDKENGGSTHQGIAHENPMRIEEGSSGEWSAEEWSAGTNSDAISDAQSDSQEDDYAYPEFTEEEEDPYLEPGQFF